MYTATTEFYTYDTLFPYTALFRSVRHQSADGAGEARVGRHRAARKRQGHEAEGHSGDRKAGAEHAGLCRAARRRGARHRPTVHRSEEHTPELQSLMRNSSAVFCLKKKHTIDYRLQIRITTTTPCVDKQMHKQW